MFKVKDSEHIALETIAVLAFFSIAFGLFLELNTLLYMALFFLFIGIFLRGLSVRIAYIWLKISSVLGAISTRVVLSVIFYIFLAPIAFLYRIFHGDFMSLKRHDAGFVSYWNGRFYEYGPKDFKNPW